MNTRDIKIHLSVALLTVSVLCSVADAQLKIKGKTGVGGFITKQGNVSTAVTLREPSGNNILDPKEDARLEVELNNASSAAPQRLNVRVLLPPGTLGVRIRPSARMVTVEGNGTKTLEFGLMASDSVPQQQIPLTVEVLDDNGSRIGVTSISIQVGEARLSRDLAGPDIELFEPTLLATRGYKLPPTGMEIATSKPTIAVKGVARDSSGVAHLEINGRDVSIPTNNNEVRFEQQLALVPGSNDVEIRATDRLRNERRLTFRVTREEGLIKGDYYALVIAIQEYDDEHIARLEHPITDAEEFLHVLQSNYTFEALHVRFLRNPDRRAIIRAFSSLQKTLSDNDNLVIFFAGHGYWDEKIRQGYWLPRDAVPDDKSEWLSNSEIRDQIRGLRTKHTLLISDACFSGAIFRTREVFHRPDASIEKIYELRSRRAITSGALKPVTDRSVFTEYLIKRLKENREAYLFAEGLYLSLREPVINNSPTHQTPLYGVISEADDEGGDFVFVRKGGS